MSSDRAEFVRQERTLIVRVTIGALAGGLAAAPFLLLLALAYTQSATLNRLDGSVADALNEWALQRPDVVTVLEALSEVTSPWTFRLVVLFLAALLWRAGSRRLATWAVVTMAAGGLLNVVLKEVVGRARPVFEEPVAIATQPSFPSGHALNSALAMGIVVLVMSPLVHGRSRYLLWGSATFVVLLTGFDRVGLGVHFFSDVLGGWLEAAAILVGTTVVFGSWRGHHPPRAADPAESRRLSPHESEEAADVVPAHDIPAMLVEIRGLVLRILGPAVVAWAVMASLGWLVVVADDVIWPLTAEAEVVQELASVRTPGRDQAVHMMNWLGDTPRIMSGLVVAAVVLRLACRRWREAAFVLAAVTVQALVFVLTTAVVSRVRPDVEQLYASPPTSSFPSGHTGAALTLYGGVGFALARRADRTWVRVLVVCVALLPSLAVAYARLYGGMHFPSDVVASYVNGGLALLIAYRAILAATLPLQLTEVLDRGSSIRTRAS